MSRDNIHLKCPKCGQKITESTRSLKSSDKLICPGCGLNFDFKEIKRGIEERVKDFKRDLPKINIRLK